MELSSIFKRIIIIFFLLLALYGLCVHYNENYESNEKYYTINAKEYYTVATIMSDYPEGKMVCVTGFVNGVYKDGFYLKDNSPYTNITYNITSMSKVNLDGEVSVLGELGPSYNIKSSQIFILNKWKYDFILLRSTIAGMLLLVLLFIYWKFDFKSFEFVRLNENHRFSEPQNFLKKILRRK